MLKPSLVLAKISENADFNSAPRICGSIPWVDTPLSSFNLPTYPSIRHGKASERESVIWTSTKRHEFPYFHHPSHLTWHYYAHPNGLEYLIQLCMRCLRGTKVFFIELSINCLIRPSAFTEIHVCLNNLWADFFDSLADAIKSWLNKIEAFLHSLFLISNHCGINFSQRILKSSLKTIAMPVILFH